MLSFVTEDRSIREVLCKGSIQRICEPDIDERFAQRSVGKLSLTSHKILKVKQISLTEARPRPAAK